MLHSLPPPWLTIQLLLLASRYLSVCAFYSQNFETKPRILQMRTYPINMVKQQQQHQDESTGGTRRSFLFETTISSCWWASSAFVLGGFSTTPATTANAIVDSSALLQSSTTADSLSLESGLLNSRVTENLINPPPYGLELPDVYYPSWFNGVWKVESTTKQVLAPCGKALFGGNATYDKAMADVGNTLRYDSRFVRAGVKKNNDGGGDDDDNVADREYNVRGIAKAAMGPNSVVDFPLATPNKLSAILAPQGAPSLLRVDLITLNRRQEYSGNDDKYHFDCSEVVREIVAPVGRSGSVTASPATILKEIETTSLYTYNPKTDRVDCRQRSATFLLPSQNSPMAMSMYQASRGRAVDVRFYDVSYVRR